MSAERPLAAAPVPPLSAMADLYRSTLTADAGLPAATLAVVGAGVLGRHIVDDLVAAGVGAIRLCDPRRDDDGEALVDRLRAELWQTGATAVAAIETLGDDPCRPGVTEDLLASCDGAVVAWEGFAPALFHHVNQAAARAGVDWTLTFVDGDELVIGPTSVPGRAACYLEYEVQARGARPPAGPAGAAAPHGVAPPYAKVAAGLASACVLRHVTAGMSPAANRVLRVDLDRFVIHAQGLRRFPRCPACALRRPTREER